MPDYFLDPDFEQRLERRLGDFAQEAVRPYDAGEIARAAASERAAVDMTRSRFPSWARSLALAALLLVTLVAAGIAGGIIRLPNNDLNPNPSFVPFSPPPFTPSPSGDPGESPPPGSPDVTFVPGSFPPVTMVPLSPLPVTFEPATPTPLPSGATPTPEISPEPTPDGSPTDAPPTVAPVPIDIVDASSGSGHQCAVAGSGRVWCWGENSMGELGDGSTDDHFFPSDSVVGIEDARQVAAGIRFSCALRAGSVSCWGEGGSGQLGNGGTAATSTPVTVTGVGNATQVVAGGTHACALRRDGSVACWGQANKVGNGSATNDSSPVSQPVEVVGLSNVVQIAAGWNHTCARRSTGTIACWGLNGDGATGYGQLGDGTLDHASTPVEVAGIDDAFSIAAGGWTTCAIRGDRSAWCWGYGERGGLGDGNSTNSAVPVQVSGITGARRIAVGGWHACTALASGSVRCWGANSWSGSFGQLGDGGSEDRSTPVEAHIDVPVLDVAAGWINSLAVTPDGGLWIWGWGGTAEPTEVSFAFVR